MLAQSHSVKNETVQYHFFTNTIPSDWNYPLIGIVNKVNGNHTSIQLGIINSTNGNFGGVQYGIVNNVSGLVTGMQTGLVNSVDGDVKGIQLGLINSGNELVGLQLGLVNSTSNSTTGVQYGLVNSSADVKGVQVGLVNSSADVIGVQIGLVNSAKTLRGLQLGLINSVDKVEKGLPIGFLSFVKQGGYKALEFLYNSVYPLNIAFKTGVRELYTYPILSYDPRMANDRFAFGYGIGSNLDIAEHLFVNPELDWLHQISLDFNHFTTFRFNLGYCLGNDFELLAGPSLIWHFKINADDFHHNYTEWDPDIVAINKLKAGFSVALRYKF